MLFGYIYHSCLLDHFHLALFISVYLVPGPGLGVIPSSFFSVGVRDLGVGRGECEIRLSSMSTF